MEGPKCVKTKLEKRQMRLLKLYPPQDRDNVQGSICVVDLDSDIPYEAISYVWGNPDLTEKIMIDQSTVRITSSLYRALLDVRLKNTTRVIWVDGICINQDDPEEKAEQVRYMPTIYARASHVMIYLGPGRPDTVLALPLFLRILDLFARSRLTEEKFLYEDEIVSLGLPPGGDNAWDALRLLASRAWFRRTWTVQEFVAAKDAFFLIGNVSIPWQVLLYGLRAASKTGLLCMMSHESRTLDKMMSALGPWSQLIRLRTEYRSGNRLPLIELLRVLSKQEVSRPVDRLFALQGLSIEAEELAKNVDYLSPQAELYEKYASNFILNGHLEEVLCQAGHAQQTLKLPSWVPDWSGHGKTHFSFAQPPKSDDKQEEKGLETRNSYSLLPEHHALQVKASMIDVISNPGSGQSSTSSSIPVEKLVSRVFGEVSIQAPVSQDETANIFRVVNMATENGFDTVVPCHTRHGDLIFSIVGCAALFVLRAESTEQGTFRLIGECYVDGIGERSPTFCSHSSAQDILLV